MIINISRSKTAAGDTGAKLIPGTCAFVDRATRDNEPTSIYLSGQSKVTRVTRPSDGQGETSREVRASAMSNAAALAISCSGNDRCLMRINVYTGDFYGTPMFISQYSTVSTWYAKK